jgi:hypothetical protein
MLPVALFALALAGVQVDDGGACVPAPEIERAIAPAIEPHPGVRVEVATSAREDGGADLALRVFLPDGSAGLARTYSVSAGDCDGGAALLGVVVDRYLRELPFDRLAPAPSSSPIPSPTPEATPGPFPASRAVWDPIRISAGGGARGFPAAAEAEAFVTSARSLGAVRISAGAGLREGARITIFDGAYEERTLLLDGGVWLDRGSWSAGLHAFPGLLEVVPHGVPAGHTETRAWVEGGASLERRFGRHWAAGTLFSATPRPKRASIGDDRTPPVPVANVRAALLIGYSP